MNKWWFVILLFPVNLLGQDTCTCARNLDRFIEKVERNYAGFNDKVNKATRPAYTHLVDSLRTVASTVDDKSICFNALERYRSYFRDKHLQLGGAFAPAEDGGPSEPPHSSTWTNALLEAHFLSHRETPRALEGIWYLEKYQVGVIYNDSAARYDAVIMRSENVNWKEGMVKFTVTEPVNAEATARYWRGDMRMLEARATCAPGHIAVNGVGTWHLVDPPAGIMDARTFELTFGDEVQWKMLDDSTLYIKLGSCDLANKAVLDSLVAANRTLLEHLPNWIIDLRGNRGGSTDVFQCLLPYLYTKPFLEYGVDHWLSPENTAALRSWLEHSRSRMDEGSARDIQEIVDQGTAHPNSWHRGGGGSTRFDTVRAMPQRVAMLADRGTASSGESFVETARGISSKTVIFGENTGGYMDYGDLMQHEIGCDGLAAAIPTSRMRRIDHGQAYDLTGIAPDVRIEPGTEDAIAIVRAYWRGSK